MNDYRELAAIAARHGSPFYLLDPAAFERNLLDFRGAFEERYPHVVLGYSYKTNYLPYLCQLARRLGAWAEVVSGLELELASRIGYPPAQIIFNGPVKQAGEVEAALAAGSVVNLDTFRELTAAIDFARRQPAAIRVGLRLNVRLVDEAGASHHQDGLPGGRFGFAAADLEKVAALVRQVPNLRVHSLHGHSSSTSRSLWVYRSIARTLAETAERHFADTVELINIGGGFFGRPVPEMGLAASPSYAQYAEAICSELQQNRWFVRRRPALVLEPGMAVVADVMSFVTRVHEVKEFAGRRLAVVDGSLFNVKPTMHRRNHPFALIQQQPQEDRGRYDVVGATCMEKDCLLQEVECRQMAVGDFLRIDNVGAYTIVLTPPFIQPAPPILVREGEAYRLLRRRQEFADLFATYTF